MNINLAMNGNRNKLMNLFNQLMSLLNRLINKISLINKLKILPPQSTVRWRWNSIIIILCPLWKIEKTKNFKLFLVLRDLLNTPDREQISYFKLVLNMRILMILLTIQMVLMKNSMKLPPKSFKYKSITQTLVY